MQTSHNYVPVQHIENPTDTSSGARNSEVAIRRGKKYNRISTEMRKLIIGKSVTNGSMSKTAAFRLFKLPWSIIDKVDETYVDENKIERKVRDEREPKLVKFSGNVHGGFLRYFLDNHCIKALGSMRQELLVKLPDLERKMKFSTLPFGTLLQKRLA